MKILVVIILNKKNIVMLDELLNNLRCFALDDHLAIYKVELL